MISNLKINFEPAVTVSARQIIQKLTATNRNRTNITEKRGEMFDERINMKRKEEKYRFYSKTFRCGSIVPLPD